MKQLTVSFIIPSFNEALNVAAVLEAIRREMVQLHYKYYDYEVLFIDDGSTDGTIETIQSLAFDYPEVKYLSFTRNFGKESAVLAGLEHAVGEAVILMDADLQHPPFLIHKLIKGFEDGYDQVIAKRNRKGESRVRSLLTSLYYRFVNKAIDVELADGEGDFRLLSRRAVNSLLLLSEGNRFSKGLYSWIGLDQTTVCYDNIERENGKTKWTFSKLLNYGIDGIVSFNRKPLRICVYFGAIILILSLVYLVTTYFRVWNNGVSVPSYFIALFAILFLGGIQLICLGVIGEYIGRIYSETKKRPHYLVKQTNIEEREQYAIHQQ
ncbi:glycosyltransferase family 2 protein [Virgibacillus alimentarius]|uniref:Glycosyltransferase involved in cell wall biosynthesis n=1 Tax=Virgibacillus alimentarius TaxID=698769 RepID=A0ABS4S970_9BACI|nr:MULTISPECIES: glycosyltransferase family 2 protein [Virgibacillus]MBP2257525.1 glycosyltransferase involved in cell wall biosynthesis [Virgibacillus alimentarius]HLR68877.1 glycosyltransferase family 2 protein [Virgibacillus sp.]